MKWAFLVLLWVVLTIGVFIGGRTLDYGAPYQYEGYLKAADVQTFDNVVLDNLKTQKACYIKTYDELGNLGDYHFVVIADDFPMGNKSIVGRGFEIGLPIAFTLIYWLIASVVLWPSEKKAN
jgi:hypothetical protein